MAVAYSKSGGVTAFRCLCICNICVRRVSYTKAIDVWTFTAVVFVFAALVEFAIVNVLARRQRLAEEFAAKNLPDDEDEIAERRLEERGFDRIGDDLLVGASLVSCDASAGHVLDHLVNGLVKYCIIFSCTYVFCSLCAC